MATTVTLKPNAIDISGSTSGTTTLQATAVAGTTTLTLPAATDTLVGKATTDTLTNKTLTGAAMNGTVGATTPSTGAFTTVSATTTIGVGSATPSASGAGITFPATQSASTNANTLDDYEEGTWTATFVVDSGSVTTSSTIRYGNYTKIGRQVTITCLVTATAISSPGGSLYIFTLPFPVSSTAGRDSAVSISGNNFSSSAATTLVGVASTGVSYIQINSYNAGSQSLMAANLTSSSSVTITATYFTD